MNNIVRQKSDKFICVSRPRRFGKTMAANMIAAYYTKGADSHDAFKGLNIESDPSFEEYINKYNVLKIDCGEIYYSKNNGRSFVEEINFDKDTESLISNSSSFFYFLSTFLPSTSKNSGAFGAKTF